MSPFTYIILVFTISICSCTKKIDETKAWEIRSQNGDETTVIGYTKPEVTSLSDDSKNRILEEINLKSMKSVMISLVRKPEVGVTWTIGPYWLEKHEDIISLREIEGYDDSGKLLGRSIAHGNAKEETMKLILIDQIEEMLRNTKQTMPSIKQEVQH